MTFKALIKAISVAGLVISSTAGMAAEKPLMTGASASMLVNTCAGCHGTNGASQGPAAPTISGLSTVYFVETMQGFANGDIPSTIMERIAKGYTEEELKTMAEYLKSKPFIKANQSYDKAMVKDGKKLHKRYCEKCHGDGGTSAEDDAGVLAGQWTPYLKWQLAYFKAGDRIPPKKMKKQLRKMLERKGKRGLEALLSYYASQQK